MREGGGREKERKREREGPGPFPRVRAAPAPAPADHGFAEPGYYEDGNFGIRIENCLEVVEAHPPHNFGNTGFLRFEPLTLFPIQACSYFVAGSSAAINRSWSSGRPK